MKKETTNTSRSDMDKLIDSAIEHYSSAEPRPGLEQRLRARLKDAPAPATSWLWRVALPAAMASLVAAGALYFAYRPAPHPGRGGTETAAQAPETEPHVSSPQRAGAEPVGAGNTAPTGEDTVAAVRPPHTPATVNPAGRTAQRAPIAVGDQEELLVAFLRHPGAMETLRAIETERSAPPEKTVELSIAPLSIEFLPGFDPDR